MASVKNLPPGNPNNRTQDPRVVWEDGTIAIIEAGDYPVGIPRSKSRKTLKEAAQQVPDAGLTTAPGAGTIANKDYVTVWLKDLLGTPVPGTVATPTTTMTPAAFRGAATPTKPLPPDFPGKNVPEYPHTCLVCKGKYYQGWYKTIHESTENGPLAGACPGPAPSKYGRLQP